MYLCMNTRMHTHTYLNLVTPHKVSPHGTTQGLTHGTKEVSPHETKEVSPHGTKEDSPHGTKRLNHMGPKGASQPPGSSSENSLAPE